MGTHANYLGCSGNEQVQCEDQVDMFLSSHCKSAELPTNVLNMLITPSLTDQARITVSAMEYNNYYITVKRTVSVTCIVYHSACR